jgi:hypothetical protein
MMEGDAILARGDVLADNLWCEKEKIIIAHTYPVSLECEDNGKRHSS